MISIRRVALPILIAGALVLSASVLPAQDNSSGIRWNFDEANGPVVHDSLGNVNDRVEGFWNRVPGVAGSALQFDGYTTRIVRAAKGVPVLGDSFTISAWVAVDDYPWNWVPIADQDIDHQIGFFFGIDAFGHLGLRLSVNGVWQQLTSEARLPLKKWSLITATFDPQTGLALYLDGNPVGTLKTTGNFVQAKDADLIIGRVRAPELPFPSWLSHPQDPFKFSFDGYVDELEIVPHARSAQDEMAAFELAKAPQGEVIPYAVLPSGPAGAGQFGAMPATLKFKKTWDRPRRIGPDSDVVVRFGQSPIRLVFWQGTNYVPAWVTENGKWYCEQFIEAWAPPRCTGGEDCEPMSDKQSRYSHASILESTPARVVVHWRYALADTRNYRGASPDPDTGWWDWADEYWTVYPDGIAVRKQILWSSSLEDHEWQETIVIHGPGQKPEDNIQPDALTLENMQGEAHTYHWGPKTDENFDYPKGPSKLDLPAGANIQVVNMKSKWKPFEIVPPGGVHFHVYNGERSYSMFEWWNHWPVAQIPSSGRPAVAPDRASHTSLSDIYWGDYAKTSDTETKIMISGLTSLTPQQLLPLAKSWISPPAVKATGADVQDVAYDASQRAFVVHRSPGAKPSTLELVVEASAGSPLVNPAFVVENWSGNARILVNGKPLKGDQAARMGTTHRLKADNLILWLPMQSNEKTDIKLEPIK